MRNTKRQLLAYTDFSEGVRNIPLGGVKILKMSPFEHILERKYEKSYKYWIGDHVKMRLAFEMV